MMMIKRYGERSVEEDATTTTTRSVAGQGAKLHATVALKAE